MCISIAHLQWGSTAQVIAGKGGQKMRLRNAPSPPSLLQAKILLLQHFLSLILDRAKLHGKQLSLLYPSFFIKHLYVPNATMNIGQE